MPTEKNLHKQLVKNFLLCNASIMGFISADAPKQRTIKVRY